VIEFLEGGGECFAGTMAALAVKRAPDLVYLGISWMGAASGFVRIGGMRREDHLGIREKAVDAHSPQQ